MSQTVVFVHGLWMNGLELALLRKRVRMAGFKVRQFRYHTVRNSVDENARELAAYLAALDGPVNLVGHSLAGLVILRALEIVGERHVERVVLMGSPVRGSRAARRMWKLPFGARLLGRSAEDPGLIDGCITEWSGRQAVGVLAGTRRFGLGRLFGPLPVPNDGTVAVAETMLAGAADTVLVDVTHTSMVVSKVVAWQVIHFLCEGTFDHSTLNKVDSSAV